MAVPEWMISRRGLLGIALASGGAAAGRLVGVRAPATPGPATPDPSPQPSLAAAPPAEPAPEMKAAQVDLALAALDGVVATTMAQTGVPGMAVGVVYRDKVAYLKGFGVRKVGAAAAVDADTVFQLASVSKPIASTVVAGLVGDKKLSWDDPIAKFRSRLRLSDRWVTDHVTVADLFSHRSGLPDHAGDLLEDLGYDRDYILEHLRLMPLGAFRASYAYTNFGLTAGAAAVATAAGANWADISERRLYRPLGMDSTSSRFADFAKAANRAYTHVQTANGWEPRYVRRPDQQSPAGGVSSSARDMTQWLRLQLGAGMLGGTRIVDEAALVETHIPHAVSSPPRAPAGEPGFYGLGFNVNYDERGRLRLSHSGAFALGAATSVVLLPTENLGMVVLTNGAPVGAAETVSQTFFDIAQNGHQTVDWAGLLAQVFAGQLSAGRSPTDYAHPPAGARPPRAASAYAGTYANDYFGPLVVSAATGGLTMSLGPGPTTFALTPYDGDTFSFETTGENAVGRSGVTFHGDPANRVTVEAFNHERLGTFTR